MAALIVGAPFGLRAAPPVLEPVVFSPPEVSEYEEAVEGRKRKFLAVIGGSALATVAAAGVTLLAVGLAKGSDYRGLTTGGVGCLIATVGGAFIGLELLGW